MPKLLVGRNIVYRPPETDSEDDYDGFSFGDDYVKKEPPRSHWVADVDQDLYDAVQDGSLEKVKQQVEMLQFDVNEPIKNGLVILLHACKEGFLDIVRYLLEERRANANIQMDSVTPLFYACDCTSKESHVVEKIVQLLLKHDAAINVSDKYGTTPFMLACKHGYTAVVRLMLKDVSFDAVDNQGCTPIFHAIENNHPEIVKLLIEAGVNATIANQKGYTPVQVAQFHGFYDLLDILPKLRDSYCVPSQFLSYNTLRDYIPRIFLKSDCPEYFQEIYSILLSINMELYLEFFAKGQISLAQFLCMNDESLAAVGIKYPIYRMKIMKGLLDFHLHHWSKKSIARVSKSSQENFYEILMITANHLQHLVIINSALRFVKHNLKTNTLGQLSLEQLHSMQRNLNAYRLTIKDLRKTTEYLATFSPPKNPLYIDYHEYLAERKRRKFKSYFKYTTLILGISVFICLKVKHIF